MSNRTHRTRTSHFVRRTWHWWSLGLLVGVSACGGGGDSPTEPPPPPPPPTVASVSVSPATAMLVLPATVQLTAQARDAQGNAVAATIVWSSSASAVATVSQTGLVTAVGAGSASITATAGGHAGTATISVAVPATSPFGPVVDKKDIGPAGGTLGNADVAVTIPGGALLGTRTVSLVRDTVFPVSAETPRGSAVYLLDGLPSGQEIALRLAVRPSVMPTGERTLALEMPSLASAPGSDNKTYSLGLQLAAATDSSGWLVSTVSVSGRSANWSLASGTSRLPSVVSAAAGRAFEADVRVSAAGRAIKATVASGRFEVFGWPGRDADMDRKVRRTATLIEQAWQTITTELGYAPPARPWPMQVLVRVADAPYSDSYGLFRQYGDYPYPQRWSTIEFNRTHVDDAEYAGTVMHELFHFFQQAYQPPTEALYGRNGWFLEVTSSWVESKHPASPNPYPASVARSWGDSLYAGFSHVMVPNSGYGRSPLMKYVTNRWGDAMVKNIFTAAKSGTPAVDAFVSAIPEPVHLWWPAFLTSHLGGSVMPWTTEQLLPWSYHKYAREVRIGRRAFETASELWALDTEFDFLMRDTAQFGPNFRLPVFLDSSLIGKARVLVFDKPAAATHFRPIVGTDTVYIPGHRLQSRDSLLLVVTSTDAKPPYNTLRPIGVRIDLSVPSGDWRADTLVPIADGTRFQCSQPGDSVTFNVISSTRSTINAFANSGTWKRQETPSWPAEYVWEVSPAYRDSFAMMGVTLSSTVRETSGDTILLDARLTWDLLSGASAQSRAVRLLRSDVSGWWWLLVPLALVPVAGSRRVRRSLPVIGAALVVLVAGCGIGFIGFDIDETFQVVITKARFTADPAAPTAPLLEVREATGWTTLDRYRAEAWKYTYDERGAKTDSVKSVCTGSGTASYQFRGAIYNDGVVPPGQEDEDEEDILAALVGRSAGHSELAARLQAIRANGLRP